MSNKHGGFRKNAGRKPVTDKKIQISLYLEKSKLNVLGGPDALKVCLYNYISKLCVNN